MFLAVILMLCVAPVGRVAAQDTPDPLRGYSKFAEVEARLKRLQSTTAVLSSLGQTAQKRDIWLLTMADDPQQVRPAILVVGNVVAPHLLGRELALRMAEQIANQADSDANIKELLSRFTLYFLPSPTPDATEKNFRFPVNEARGNANPSDDDRDFEIGEDPAVDLNRDGWITLMRVKEDFGTHRLHPKDPRVLIPIDANKREAGQYRLLTEANDQDQDEMFGEDSADGVDFNRNFTFNYKFFGKGVGPHQVSEPESRAVADFMFDHPNIACVVCFSPEENLFNTWKGSSQTDSARIKTKALTADQRYLDCLAEAFRKLHGGKSAPKSPEAAGSFAEFSYFHFGRWTFASRGWWIPALDKDKDKDKAKDKENNTDKADGKPAGDKTGNQSAETKSAPSESEKKPAQTDVQSDAVTTEEPKSADSLKSPVAGEDKSSDAKSNNPPTSDADAKPAVVATPACCAAEDLDKDDKRGADELAALAWFEQQGIAGFVDWQPYNHPDLPGKQVEIGGFKPLMLLNPPESQIGPLVQPHVSFLTELARNWPKLQIAEVKVASKAGGLYDIRCKIINHGALPTMPEMGAVNRQWYPIQVKLEGADNAKLIEGSLRTSLGRLEATGGSQEVKWVFLLGDGTQPGNFKITASAPTLPSVEVQVEVSKP